MQSENDFWAQIESVVEILKRSKRIFIITGAGISAESGLPTYRGISGLYNKQDTEDGVRIEEALSGPMMLKDPKLTWKYLSQMEEACRGKSFNRAHEVIALMEKRFERICIFTQNVDGFHHKAGSTNIVDIHGNLHDLICQKCSFNETVKNYADLEIPPLCPNCNAILRPDVVLFEEMLSNTKMQKLSLEYRNGFDVVFSIGTTSVFPYIAQPVIAAYNANIPTIEINPTQTSVSDFITVKIPEKAVKTMNAIWLLLNKPSS